MTKTLKSVTDSLPPDDVLLIILCLSDISTVVSAGKVDRHFHALATTKQVWLALLSDLYRRNFLDLPPGTKLDILSLSELLVLAQRVVLGPKSWSQSNLITARHVSIKHPNVQLHERAGNDTLLLPRGEFLITNFFGLGIECWNVSKQELLWQKDKEGEDENHPDHMIVTFASALKDGGQTAVIVPWVRHRNTALDDFYSTLEVITLDLVTGSFTSMLKKEILDSAERAYYACRHLRISGDFVVAATGMKTAITTITIIQISTEKSLSLSSPGSPLDIGFVSEYLVVLNLDEPTNTLALTIYNLHSLLDGKQGGEHQRLGTTSPTIRYAIVIPLLSNPTIRLACHPSPLSTDCSRLWVIFAARGNQARTFIHRYHVSHTRGQPIVIQLMSQWERAGMSLSDPSPWSSTFISYAGPVMAEDRLHFLSLAGGDSLDFHDSQDEPTVSTYSGAVTYSTSQGFAITYYE